MDALGYRDEVYAAVRKQAGPDAYAAVPGPLPAGPRAGRAGPQAADPARARRRADLRDRPDPARPQRPQPAAGGGRWARTRSAAALRARVADDRAKAIVLRVNSPGGSYVASDTIWREVVRARSAGKPVVVSMGDVAASGGYFISMAADAIVAQPGTLTGSIGVLSRQAGARRAARPGRGDHGLGDRGRARGHVRHHRGRTATRNGS